MSDKKYNITVQLGGIGFYLAFIFSLLKITNVIDAPWWLILLPLWIPYAVFAVILALIILGTFVQILIDKPKF